MKIFARAMVLIFVTGCTASVQHASAPQRINSERVTERNYEIGQPRQTYVGDTMIRVQDYRVDNYSGQQVRIARPFRLHGAGIDKSFQIGETFPYGGRTLLDDVEMEFFRLGSYGIVFDSEGRVRDDVLNLSGGGPPVFIILDFETDSQAGSIERATSQRRTSTAEGRNFEIVYSGLDGDSIRLNYREYTDANLARQPFFQELSYPRSSTNIRFRDMVIQVNEATPELINFSVLEHGPAVAEPAEEAAK